MLDLLAIGEVMAEIRQSPDGEYCVGFAGDTFNSAVYCAREMGSTGRVGYLSRVGHDPMSNSLLAFATAENIDTASISQDAERNIGIYSVSTDAAGERSFHYWRDQSAARSLFSQESDFNLLANARVVYLSGITLAILEAKARERLLTCLLELSRAGNTLVAFDSNYRPKLWQSPTVARNVMQTMWSFADIAFPSIDDEMMLFEDADEAAVIDRFAQREWKACAIKRGARGPLSPNSSTLTALHFPAAESVVDTTAAGDSFNGAYIAAYLSGADEAACLLAGHRCASKVVGAGGAIIPRQSM